MQEEKVAGVPQDEKHQEKPEMAMVERTEGGALPSFPTKNQIKEYSEFLKNYDEFIGTQLTEKVDFGVIPGVEKPSLFKPGAEKLEKLMFLRHEKVLVEKITLPDYIKYTYKTIVYDKNGNVKATCEGTSNSKETKYRYTTVFENQATPEQKTKGVRMEKRSKMGKAYFIYRIEKDDFYDVENTIMKMAQKRSYVGAILEATNSSGRFTQDVEDMAEFSGKAPVGSQNQPVRSNFEDKRVAEGDKTVAYITNNQSSFIMKLVGELGMTQAGLEKQIGKPLIQLTMEGAGKVIEQLLGLKKKKNPETPENIPVVDAETGELRYDEPRISDAQIEK